ncbi:hypothetical protein ACPF04_07730 [Campylobacter sp. MOP51]|uniref:hypothetical protein n=1 Tax=Campylobacter canis TaxID=3378588 RepID=UPI003C5B239D
MWIFRRVAILIVLGFLFTGCFVVYDSSDEVKLIYMDDMARIYSKDRLFSLMGPLKTNIRPQGSSGSLANILHLRWGIQDVMVAFIRIKTDTVDTFESEFYLKKENIDAFEKSAKANPNQKYYNKKYARTYKEGYLDYIDGVKCRSFHASTPFNYYEIDKKDMWGAIWTEEYETYCSIYQADGKPGLIVIYYEYSYNIRNKDLFKGDDKSNQQVLDMIKNEFRGHIQTVFTTIKFHNIDREKMRKEGLLVDKPYKVQF